MKNNGYDPKHIESALNLSVVEKLIAVLQRIGYSDSIVFSRGCKKRCITRLLQERLHRFRKRKEFMVYYKKNYDS
ncbi:MAG: hypothetical protein QW561_04085 [Candidatus Aenigmatarchaeota archaeon]